MNAMTTEVQQLSIAQHQDQMHSQLEGLVALAGWFLGNDWEDEILLDCPGATPGEGDGVNEIENLFVLPTHGNPELIYPPLPSYIRIDCLQKLGLSFLAEQELSLRQGQANDCLHEVQLALADKAVIFWRDVRHVRNYNMTTQAWGWIANTDAMLQWYAKIYCWCCRQMVALGAGMDILDWYCELHNANLNVTTAIAEPNARGHQDDTLAWFWPMDLPCVDQTTITLSTCAPKFGRIAEPPESFLGSSSIVPSDSHHALGMGPGFLI
ncbi:hypothetical protein V8B97DRAFT_2024182 [Scleroderma yunnanense]